MSLETKTHFWDISQIFRNTMWFLFGLIAVYAIVYFSMQEYWTELYFRWMYELSFVFIFFWFLLAFRPNKWIESDYFLGTDLAKPSLSKWWFWLLIFIVNSICLSVVTLEILVELFPEYADTILESEELDWSSIEYLSLSTSIFFAPFIEECLFRGVIFQDFTKRWGFTIGAFGSSLAFALLHPFSFVDAFIFGLAMCVFFYKTKRLYLVILFHILYNIVAYFLTSWDSGGTTEDSYLFLQNYWWVFLIIALFTMTSIIIFINKNWIRNNSHEIPYERG